MMEVCKPIETLKLTSEKLYDGTGLVTPGQSVSFTATTAEPFDVNYSWTDSKNSNLNHGVTEQIVRLYKDYTMTVSAVDERGVCEPVTATRTVEVIWPTAITPYTKDGLNDEFLPDLGCQMIIFNRYGQKVYEGTEGWDGYYSGKLADPGAYFYVVNLPDGEVKKGTIEIVKIK